MPSLDSDAIKIGWASRLKCFSYPSWLVVTGTMEFYDFPYIYIYGKIFIPTDFHIFQRGRYTTNQLHIVFGLPYNALLKNIKSKQNPMGVYNFHYSKKPAAQNRENRNLHHYFSGILEFYLFWGLHFSISVANWKTPQFGSLFYRAANSQVPPRLGNGDQSIYRIYHVPGTMYHVPWHIRARKFCWELSTCWFHTGLKVSTLDISWHLLISLDPHPRVRCRFESSGNWRLKSRCCRVPKIHWQRWQQPRRPCNGLAVDSVRWYHHGFWDHYRMKILAWFWDTLWLWLT